MVHAGRAPGGAGAWLLAALLTAWFAGLALATAPARYAAGPLAELLALYALLAAALAFGAAACRRTSRALGLLASFAIGAVAAWHLREQALVPARPLAFGLLVAALGALVYPLLPAAGRPLRALGAASASAGLFAALLALGFHASNELRWHLLRHNKLLGTPAYYLLSERVPAVEEALWARHRGADSPAPPLVRPPVHRAGVPPNLVFAMVDTLRADALAAYGGDPDLMPELARFAQGALVFEDVIANASWTRPSVASFFTGLLQEQHAAVDRPHRLPEERFTLAEALRAAGYETAAFVANFGAVGRDAGFDQGFDHFAQVEGGTDPYARAERMNAVVAEWLASRPDPARPVFLYVHYLDPHNPYLSGGGDSVLHAVAREAYDAELRYLDGRMRSFFDLVDERLPGPTAILVTSDHGEEFGEHGERGHGKSLYREVVAIPALLRTPRGDVGRVPAKLEGRDFFELFLRLAASADFDARAWARERSRGRRYTSIYAGTPSALHRPYLSHVCMRALEEGDRVLIWSAYGSTLELYDVASDPAQSRNLASEQPDALVALRADLENHMPSWSERVPVQHSHETTDLLRALGYVE